MNALQMVQRCAERQWGGLRPVERRALRENPWVRYVSVARGPDVQVPIWWTGGLEPMVLMSVKWEGEEHDDIHEA